MGATGRWGGTRAVTLYWKTEHSPTPFSSLLQIILIPQRQIRLSVNWTVPDPERTHNKLQCKELIRTSLNKMIEILVWICSMDWRKKEDSVLVWFRHHCLSHLISLQRGVLTIEGCYNDALLGSVDLMLSRMLIVCW